MRALKIIIPEEEAKKGRAVFSKAELVALRKLVRDSAWTPKGVSLQRSLLQKLDLVLEGLSR